MTTIATTAEYQKLKATGKPLLLDFYADWCGPCQVQLPVVEKLSKAHEDDFIIAKINVDKNRELAQKYGVRSIPALFFVKDGEIAESLVGVQSEIVLENKIQQYS